MNDPEQENARWTLCYELSGSYLLVGMRCVSPQTTVLTLETMPDNEQTWCIGGQLEARSLTVKMMLRHIRSPFFTIVEALHADLTQVLSSESVDGVDPSSQSSRVSRVESSRVE